MKIHITACAIFLVIAMARAGEVILPYSAFGPQAAAYKLIGMEWWQWDSHGDSKTKHYPIKVVVFWDQTREETAKNHPVNQAKLQDFRYLGYADAIAHLERTIKEFKDAQLDASTMEHTLKQLEKQKAEQSRGANALPRAAHD